LMIQADSLEQAVQIAEDCPGFKFGQTVEVRAIGPDLSSREDSRRAVSVSELTNPCRTSFMQAGTD
jgi:hypothetical protein